MLPCAGGHSVQPFERGSPAPLHAEEAGPQPPAGGGALGRGVRLPRENRARGETGVDQHASEGGQGAGDGRPARTPTRAVRSPGGGMMRIVTSADVRAWQQEPKRHSRELARVASNLSLLARSPGVTGDAARDFDRWARSCRTALASARVRSRPRRASARRRRHTARSTRRGPPSSDESDPPDDVDAPRRSVAA